MDNLTAGNPVAHRVRVYYTGSNTIKEGEPLNYSFKTTKNWWGGSVGDDGVVTTSDTSAEGTQNASKYINVETPLQISLSSDTPADGSKTITGTTTDFDTLQVGMFVSIAGTDVTNGNYEITAISRSTESDVTNSTITLGNMADATGTTADVTTKIGNISAFAGIVAKGGWVGKSGPRVVDIYVPNGAIVPVRTDQNCTLGKTILAIHTNEQFLTAPFESGGRAVAIAWETVRADTTTGLVLAKLSDTLFIYQKGDDDVRLEVDDEDTGNMMVNQIIVGTSQASGLFSAFQIKAYVTGGDPGSWDYGLALNVSADIPAGTITNGFNASGHWLNLGAGTLNGGHYSALRAGIYEDGTTTTFTSVASIAPLSLAVQLGESPGSNNFAMIYCRSDGSTDPDYFLIAEQSEAVGTVVGNSDTVDFGIPIKIGGTNYWIALTSATS
jgi:hypothetical protein